MYVLTHRTSNFIYIIVSFLKTAKSPKTAKIANQNSITFVDIFTEIVHLLTLFI